MDDIANLAFISGDTNRKISKAKFSDYYPEFVKQIGPGQFEMQSIPLDEDLRAVDAYKRFLAARRVQIASRLNVYLGTAK